MFQTGKAQVFHVKIFDKNQMDSNLTRWESVPEEDGTDILYFAQDFHWGYEPIYVAQKTVPAYHERFVGYGGTRNTQVRRGSKTPQKVGAGPHHLTITATVLCRQTFYTLEFYVSLNRIEY